MTDALHHASARSSRPARASPPASSCHATSSRKREPFVTSTVRPPLSSLSTACDDDRARVRVDRVLHELGDRLARIALAAREPANHVERVGRLEPDAARISLRTRRLAIAARRSDRQRSSVATSAGVADVSHACRSGGFTRAASAALPGTWRRCRRADTSCATRAAGHAPPRCAVARSAGCRA
jgi:hypothetical protein